MPLSSFIMVEHDSGVRSGSDESGLSLAATGSF